MGTASDKRRAEIVQMLIQAADHIADAVGSGRLGFDYAVKEYVAQSEDELAEAFGEYVRALGLGDETQRITSAAQSCRNKKVRRRVLTGIADGFVQTALRGPQPFYLQLWYTTPHVEIGTDSTGHVFRGSAPRPAPRHAGLYSTAPFPT